MRAADAIARAEVLLYDALVSEAIVERAPVSCERIFVGKRGGNHALPQDEIEALMLSKAREGKRVVRLKGGDPFVFGRGGEEAQRLRAAGIAFEVVPGITSAIAAPAYAGIPVTHRDCNTAFTVLTGHEDPTKPGSTIDWKRLADPHQTLVILMGIGELGAIARRLIDEGLPASRPTAIVQNGTRPSQRTLVSELGRVAQDAAAAGIRAPAIVVCGEVVNLRAEIDWFESSPLFGKRVLITRPADQARVFADALLRAGAEPVVAPAIAILPPVDEAAADDAARRASSYAWIVFTSANGVRAFFHRLDACEADARALRSAKVAAIGEKTAEALARRGVRADLVPDAFVAEALAEALIAAGEPGDRILLYRAAEARDVLPERLRAAGRTVETVAAYRTVTLHDENFAQAAQRCDVITFTSASTVRGFVENLGGAEAAAQLAAGKTVACIGPITASAAEEAGMRVDVTAERFTAEGLIEALERACASSLR